MLWIILIIVGIIIGGRCILGRLLWKFSSPDKHIVVKASDDKNLVKLTIIDKRHGINEIKKTRAASYLNFEITFWGNNNFLFDSSDIGSALFSYNDDQWYGMNVFSFLSPNKELIAILVPKAEKMKQTDGIDRKGEELKDSKIGLTEEYELLVLAHAEPAVLVSDRWYFFPVNHPPFDAISWLKQNEFLLKEKDRSIYFTIKKDHSFSIKEE